MKVYSVFDDFTKEAAQILKNENIELDIHSKGLSRPDSIQLKSLLEDYDGLIIGTGQKMGPDCFKDINAHKIIATASVGTDHIQLPDNKKDLIKIMNTPKSNKESVAEYTIACALMCCKRIIEAASLYKTGKNNKSLFSKPVDLAGKTIGVVGAGPVSICIMQYAKCVGMNVLCWTKHPEKHVDLIQKNVEFCSTLTDLAEKSDVISVNLPKLPETENIISADIISAMKENTVFISTSRLETVDLFTLIKRAKENRNFYICADLDIEKDIVMQLSDNPNIIITPHIAGGTVESRNRMFYECATNIITYAKMQF